MADISKLMTRARLEELGQNWIGAIELYTQAVHASEQTEHSSPDLSLYNRIGDLHLRLAEVDTAVDCYELSIERYAENDYPSSAIALCNKVLRIQPDRISAYLRLGQLQLSTGLVAEARVNYLRYATELLTRARQDEAYGVLSDYVGQTGDLNSALRFAGTLVANSRSEEALDLLLQLKAHLESVGGDVQALQRPIEAIQGFDSEELVSSVEELETEMSEALIDRRSDAPGSIALLEAELDAAVGDAKTVEEEAPQAATETLPSPDAETVVAAGRPAGAKIPLGPDADEPIERDMVRPAAMAGSVGPEDGLEATEELPTPSSGILWPDADSEEPFIFAATEAGQLGSLETATEAQEPRSTLPGAPVLPEVSVDALEPTLGDEARPVSDGWPTDVVETTSELATMDTELFPLERESSSPTVPPLPGGFATEESELSRQRLPEWVDSEPSVEAEAVWTSSMAGEEAVLDEEGIEQSEERADAEIWAGGSEDTESTDPFAHRLEKGTELPEARDLEAAVPQFELATKRPDSIEESFEDWIQAATYEVAERALPELERRGEMHKAQMVVERLVDIKASDPAPHREKVEVARALGEEKGLAQAFLELGQVLEAEGQLGEARATYFRALEYDPDSGSALRSIERVEEQAAVLAEQASSLEDWSWDEPGPAGQLYPKEPTAASPEEHGSQPSYPSRFAERQQTEIKPLEPGRAAAGGIGITPYDRREAGREGMVDFDVILAELKDQLAEGVADEPDGSSRTEVGERLMDMGLLDDAIRELQAAVRSPGAPPRAFELLGAAFIEKGQASVAARLLAEALEKLSGRKGEEKLLGVLYRLGVAYQTVEAPSKALECYERIFSVDIDYKDVKARIEDCSA